MGPNRPLWQRDTALLLYLGAVKVLLHLFHNNTYGLFRDELYYIACSDHLAWGYVDHPPLSIFILALSRSLFGDSMLAIRILAVLASGASVVLAGLLARQLGGGRGAQLLAALAYLITGWSLVWGTFFSMNSFDALLWIAAAIVVARMLRREDPLGWVAFGLVCGVGLLNKISMVFLAFGVVVGMLLTPARRLLWSRWLILGGGLAFLIFLPHLVWQAATGFPTLEFMSNAAKHKITEMSPLAFVLALVTEGNPLTAPFWLAGLFYLLLAPSMRPFRALGLAVVAIFVLFQVQTAKPYYISPAMPILLAAAGVAIESFGRTRGSWAPALAAVWLLIGGLIAAPATLPLLPPAQIVAYLQALGVDVPHEERGAKPELPQILADRLGWQNLVATVARVYQGLPADERAHAAILGDNYGEAAAVDFYGPRLGLPRAISGHNNYFLWGPGTLAGGVVISIGGSKTHLERLFTQVEQADTIVSPFAHPGETDLPIYVCRGLKLPPDRVWRALEHFV